MSTPPSQPAPGEGAGPDVVHYRPGADPLPEALLRRAPTGSPAVLLLAAGDDREWTAEAALAVAAEWARTQRVVLVDLDLEGARLHEHAGAENLDGIVDIFLYGASLTRSARPVRGRGFYLIPAGTYTPDAGALYRHPRWQKLLAGLRETGAALLLYAPADAPDVQALGAWAREALVLGDDGGRWADTLPAHWKVHAVLVPPADPAPAQGGEADAVEAPALAAPPPEQTTISVVPAHAAEEEPGAPEDLVLPPPQQRRGRRWWVTPVLAVLLLAVVAAALTYAALTRWPDLFRGGASEPATVPNPVQPVHRPPPAQPAGEAAPYAVRTQAFSTLAAAWEQARENAGSVGEVPFYVSVEEIQRHQYYKVMAGLLTDTAAAGALRARLAQARIVDTDDAAGAGSQVELVPYTFDLGTRETRVAAAQRVDSLYALQVAAYAAAVPYSDGSTRWHLYAGAFRDSASAEVMRQSLERQDLEARLVERRAGRDTTPE